MEKQNHWTYNRKFMHLVIATILISINISAGSSNKFDIINEQPAKNIKIKIIKKSYVEDTNNIANPERGIFSQQASYSDSPSPFSQMYIDNLKERKITLVRKVYTLNTFKNSPISEIYLKHIQDDFDFLRTNGFKIILRFSYTFNEPKPHTDAPLNIVLSHIDQLEPLLQNNSDVIALMEGGFIGEWGEWHDSTSGLASTENMRIILFRLLDALPKSRTVAIRYQKAKKDIYNNNNPITEADAFDLSNRSRTAHHNDCFLAATDDWGTYWPIDDASLKEQKDYLSQENKYLPQVGETCNCNPPHSDCTNAIKELAQMRWSAINKDYIDCVIGNWHSGGCYEEIEKKVGYRFLLISSSIANAVKIGAKTSFKFVIKNNGFATPYNARNLELILRSKKDKSEYKIKLDSDPRRWLPDLNEITISANIELPVSATEGDYDLFLNLPDSANTLKNTPAYSIRFANEDTWEEKTGYNSLLASIKFFN